MKEETEEDEEDGEEDEAVAYDNAAGCGRGAGGAVVKGCGRGAGDALVKGCGRGGVVKGAGPPDPHYTLVVDEGSQQADDKLEVRALTEEEEEREKEEAGSLSEVVSTQTEA